MEASKRGRLVDPVTQQRLRTLAEQRSEAHRAFLAASERLGRVVASKPAPMAEIAAVLGISRQAVYALAEKWKDQ